jgi:ubiquinone/menaquinone biosynthesis C-methylase UbiE
MQTQKKRQLEYHTAEVYRDGTCNEPDERNPLVAWLNNYRINKMMEMIGGPLLGKSVLSVCGGDGREACYLSSRGADVTVTDLCAAAMQVAQRRSPALHCLCMDAESLGFPNRSFDWVIVREGLHHLARPVKGLYELERVSKEGFAFMEGQDSLAVRLLVKLGIGKDRDPAGGYVYRFSRREVAKIFAGVQTIARWQIHTTWMPFGSDVLRHFPAFKRFVYPVIDHPRVFRILTSGLGKRILKSIFNSLNFLTGRWGNCLIVVAWKEPREVACWTNGSF